MFCKICFVLGLCGKWNWWLLFPKWVIDWGSWGSKTQRRPEKLASGFNYCSKQCFFQDLCLEIQCCRMISEKVKGVQSTVHRFLDKWFYMEHILIINIHLWILSSVLKTIFIIGKTSWWRQFLTRFMFFCKTNAL